MAMTLSPRRLAAALGLAASVAVGGAVLATPASAGTNCAGGYHCVFWTGYGSAEHAYFNSDSNFTNDTFNKTTYGSAGSGQNVNDEVYSASNSSTGGYYSEYYVNSNYGGGVSFCVKPGSQVEYLAAALSASSLKLTTSNPGGCY